jgi:hypothetical protein
MNSSSTAHNWSALYSDRFFEPSPFAAQVVPASDIPASHPPVDISPLVCVGSVVPAGQSYHNIVAPSNAEVVMRAPAEDELDTDEIKVAVQSADIDDYYGLLNLKPDGFDVDMNVVKQNYSVISLICHPDKADPSVRQEAEGRFKAIQLGTISYVHRIYSYLHLYLSHTLLPQPTQPSSTRRQRLSTIPAVPSTPPFPGPRTA